MVSHEARHRYGAANKNEIVELLPLAKSFLDKPRADHSAAVQESTKRTIAYAQKNQLEQQQSRKKRSKK